jgi:hypothetical protein
MITSAEDPKKTSVTFHFPVPSPDTASTTAGPAGAAGVPHYHGHLSPLTASIKKCHDIHIKDSAAKSEYLFRAEKSQRQGSGTLGTFKLGQAVANQRHPQKINLEQIGSVQVLATLRCCPTSEAPEPIQSRRCSGTERGARTEAPTWARGAARPHPAGPGTPPRPGPRAAPPRAHANPGTRGPGSRGALGAAPPPPGSRRPRPAAPQPSSPGRTAATGFSLRRAPQAPRRPHSLRGGGGSGRAGRCPRPESASAGTSEPAPSGRGGRRDD